jgi:23S rRNA (uracil747-C5)-methyltransferase
MFCSFHQNQICGSCTLLQLEYFATLNRKLEVLANLFPGTTIAPFVECEAAVGSRIRARLAITGTLQDPQIGFYDAHQKIVPVDQCPLHHPLINEFTLRLRRVVQQAGLTPYDLQTDRGELKFVVLTCSPSHRQLMVQFVLRSPEAVDRIRRYWRQISDVEKQVVSVVSVNLQPIRSSLITGTQEIAVSLQTTLPFRFGAAELLFGPQSFLQTNYEVAVKLYDAAGQILRDRAADHVLDLYCGVGAFTLTAGSLARSVLGIDISANAIDCATLAAQTNQIRNAEFLCRNLDRLTVDELSQRDFDSLICNPPRRGLDAASVTLIQTLRPECIVYSSCNPITLQRDIQLLSPDYRVQHLQPFDMFPFTQHFEVLALLLRR